MVLLLSGCVQPAPQLNYWFENISPDIKVKRSVVVAVFLDPSFYYKLEAPSEVIALFIDKYQLTKYSIDLYACQAIFNKPTPWTFWWQPKTLNAPSCYEGYLNGNILYLLYVSGNSEVYLYVQNT